MGSILCDKGLLAPRGLSSWDGTANLRTSIMDFRGFDSSIILILRGGILMSIGDFLEDLSQAILVGIMLVGRLGVFWSFVAAARRESYPRAPFSCFCPLWPVPSRNEKYTTEKLPTRSYITGRRTVQARRIQESWGPGMEIDRVAALSEDWVYSLASSSGLPSLRLSSGGSCLKLHGLGGMGKLPRRVQ